MERFRSVTGSGSPTEELLSTPKLILTRKDFNTLREGQWLNDEIINGYMQLLQVRVLCCAVELLWRLLCLCCAVLCAVLCLAVVWVGCSALLEGQGMIPCCFHHLFPVSTWHQPNAIQSNTTPQYQTPQPPGA